MLKVNGLVAALDLIKPMVRGEFLVMATCGYSRMLEVPADPVSKTIKTYSVSY